MSLPRRIKELPPGRVAAAIADDPRLIVPIGTCEAHGPHVPRASGASVMRSAFRAFAVHELDDLGWEPGFEQDLDQDAVPSSLTRRRHMALSCAAVTPVGAVDAPDRPTSQLKRVQS
jgi:hypothetical protein